MHQPFKTLLFLFYVFAALAGIVLVFPKGGLGISDGLTINFPDYATFINKKEEKKDISKIIALADKLDESDTSLTSIASDTLNELIDTVKVPLINSIQFRNRDAMDKFFEALANLSGASKSIRILHYGDSQIEGDRITDYMRLKLQSQFGGNGPGLISLKPISRSITNKIENGYGWDRFHTFIAKDKRVDHKNFGVMGLFTRFCQYKAITDTSAVLSTNVTISTTRLAGKNNQGYSKFKLFYGGAKLKTWCEFYDGPALAGADSLLAGGFFNIKVFNVTPGSSQHELKFKGKDSPDFYAASLESDKGIYVDNISQRGSSGTFFHRVNFSQLKNFYDYLNVKLIILQYGGNALPSIKDEKGVEYIARYLKAQMGVIKKAAPNANILFIGPADMSVKEGTEYVTHPMLEKLRDALREAAFEQGAAFFDMYDCMGGKNSMVSWVDEKLAAKDYIHFSPQGARKIATLLYSSLISNYNRYKKRKESGK